MSNSIFGRYILTKRLAVGGMAEIFLAQQRGEAGFAKQVVLKRILPHLSNDASFIEMFIHEAVLAAQLNHPNIVQIYDFGHIDGQYYICMEFVDGIDLHHLLKLLKSKHRQLGFAEVAAIAEAIARGLSYAHQLSDEHGQPLGLVHRDISPHNIMISRTGDIKIMDFGIAKIKAQSPQTAVGMIKGKLAYMAPEQAREQPLDKRTDQFALGAVLWEALTQKALFSGDSEAHILQQVQLARIPWITELNPTIPKALVAIVMKALSSHPEARYDDLKDMEADLTNFRFTLGSYGIAHLGDWVKSVIPEVRSTMMLQEHLEGPKDLGSYTSHLIKSLPNFGLGPRGTQRLQAAPSQKTHNNRVPKTQTTTTHHPRPSQRLAMVVKNYLPPTYRYIQRFTQTTVVLSAVFLLILLVGGLQELRAKNHLQHQPQHPFPPSVAAQNPKETDTSITKKPQKADDLATTASHGFLSVQATQHAYDIYIDNTWIGSTPLHARAVPAGHLVLKLVDKTDQTQQREDVIIPENGETTLRLNQSAFP